MKAKNSNDKATGLRVAAWCLVWGYAVLLGTFMIRHPVALTIMIPLGAALVALGILLWLRAVLAEARTKDMV
jgi:hypothetical protein